MDSELRNMVMAFRVTELQNLLGHFGKNKNGRKNELQARALDLVKVRDGSIVAKIRELYRSIQLSLTQPPPASAVVAQQNNQFNNNSSNSSHHNMSSSNSTNRLYGLSSSNSEKMYPLQQQSRYVGSYNGSAQLPGMPVISPTHRVPICPDVRLRRLPFYDVQAELQRPTSLLSNATGRVQESNFTFFLSPDQAGQIASSKEYLANIGANENRIQYAVQVQMRFCALDTTCPQDDLFPPNVNVKVNQRTVPLPHPIPSNRPGVEAKRPSRPLNITNYVKISPTVTNHVNVNWASDMSGRDYVISITLVKKLGSTDLLTRLKTKGPRPAEYTKGMIKELVRKDDADCIATTSFKVSIGCPLGKCRMSLPCRASTCKHLQCFDANLYLQMNEKKPVWSCPVCDKYTNFEDIAIDGYFNEVISSLTKNGHDGNDIEVLPDGTWRPLRQKTEAVEHPAKRVKTSEPSDDSDIICLDIDDDEENKTPAPTPEPAISVLPVAKKSNPQEEVIDLTLSSDEEEVELPKQKNEDKLKSVNQPSVSSKSAEDSDDEVIRPRGKKKALFLSDESSSSSSSETDSEAKKPKAVKKPNKARSPTPECIILDSPSPSPPPPRQSNEKAPNKTTNGPAPSSSAGVSSSAQPTYHAAPPPSQWQVPNQQSTSAVPEMSYSCPPTNPFMSYDRTGWDPAAPFQSTSDFSSLEFPSMDYFNQGPSYGGGGGGRPADSGYGYGRW